MIDFGELDGSAKESVKGMEKFDLQQKNDHAASGEKGPSSAQSEAPSSRSRSLPSVNSSDNSTRLTQEETEYAPRWARSSKPTSFDEDEESVESEDEEQFLSTDELPPFSDDVSKALHREIKQLEQRRDKAAKSARANKERIDIINGYLQSIRQEIEHTNSLVAAKKDEADTEVHLLSLAQREVGQCLRDSSTLEDEIATKQKKIVSIGSHMSAAQDELEKLKIDLNWNQEELEQWATAANKKEEENLALQKYTLADELKIKELTLLIEDLTKRSVEKKSMLENEVAETRSNQTELEKLAERFKSRHDERRQLIQQWKDTIESMNNRDKSVNELATQYALFTKREDEQKTCLVLNRENHEVLEMERDETQQEIIHKERFLQSKRQDLSSIQETLFSIGSEVDSLQKENASSATSLENKRKELKLSSEGLQQKKERAAALTKLLGDVKCRLAEEKLDTNSKERVAESIEETLAERGKMLKQAETNLSNLKNKMYKESQKLAELRKTEANLISEIRGTQSNTKNFSSKLNDLESKRTRQQEILYNANFQLQQMEKKVSRGLGERSNEEQKELQSRIEALEKELASEKEKKAMLTQQHKKLQAELRIWNRKHEATDSKYNETVQRIDDIALEIHAYQLSLKEIIEKRDEALVSHDVTLLDVRRLRDSLRSLLEEICFLEQQHIVSTSETLETKEATLSRNEVKIAQLRATKEERHKTAIELGRLKVVLNKTQSKYEMVNAINNSENGDGEKFESPEYKLILAAQRREELQQEGDKLDETIQTKENEIRTMKKTLRQLRESNTNFRSSFSKADMNGAKAQELKEMERKSQMAEESLFKIRKELQTLEKSAAEDESQLNKLNEQVAALEEKNGKLLVTKAQCESDADSCKAKLNMYKGEVANYQGLCNKSTEQLHYKKFVGELVQIQCDRISKLLIDIGKEFPELNEDIVHDMEKEGLIC